MVDKKGNKELILFIKVKWKIILVCLYFREQNENIRKYKKYIIYNIRYKIYNIRKYKNIRNRNETIC